MRPTFLHQRALPALDAAAAWARERSRREQVLLAFFGGLLGVAVFWYALVQPMLLAREAAIARITSYEAIKARLGGGATVATAAEAGALDAMVRSQAAAFSLTPTTLETQGRDVAVTIVDARYDSVIPWLAALESSDRAMLGEVRIQRRSAPGVVNVQLKVRPE